MSVTAGVGRADITPPVGIRLSGYASRATGSTGIHDDLAVTALYLEQDGAPAALVGLDVIMFGAEEVAAIRRVCQKLTGIPADCIMVACTHTHAGPQTGPGDDDPLQAAYAECLRWQIAGALREARLRAQPARLAHTRQAVRLAGNRRERTPQGTILGYNPDAPTPTHTDILQVTSEAGESLAALVVYDCHGTTLGPDNYLISADYQGHARRLVEGHLPGCRAMVLGGCGANQNPYPRGTHAWAERHGRRLGAAAHQAWLQIEETAPVRKLAVHVHEAKLPVAALPSLTECRKQLTAARKALAEEKRGGSVSWLTERRLRHAQERLAAAERGETDLGIPVELQTLALDDTALIALPGEIFFEIGQAIRAASPFAVTLPLGWSNGSIGYIPTEEEVAFGGYEVEMARASHLGLPARDDADKTLIAKALASLQAAHSLTRRSRKRGEPSRTGKGSRRR